MAPLLRVSGLRTVFPAAEDRPHAPVDGVSFELERGETLALMGESGSGKSLTALSIVRLVPPPGAIAGGRIELEGENLRALTPRAMGRIRGRKIGFVFQDPSAALNPVFSIGFQIAETLAVHGISRGRDAWRRAVELLDAVHVPEPERRAHAYPHQLSGGLQQRAMIALALAADPPLLIADEPTTALDTTVQAGILDLLRELRSRRALAVLLITHDFGVVAELADRVAVMHAGRIVEEGPVEQIFDSPASPHTRQLLASVPGTRSAPPRPS
jgi:ABC-type dipeptide/oligopeptide/nickel transport system ATPase component